MTATTRTIRRLLDIEPDALADDELLPYVYACRSAMRWALESGAVAPAAPTAPERVDRRRNRPDRMPKAHEAMQAVEAAGWVVAVAARAVGISPMGLRRRLDHAPQEWLDRLAAEQAKGRAERAAVMRQAPNPRGRKKDLEDARELMRVGNE